MTLVGKRFDELASKNESRIIEGHISQLRSQFIFPWGRAICMIPSAIIRGENCSLTRGKKSAVSIAAHKSRGLLILIIQSQVRGSSIRLLIAWYHAVKNCFLLQSVFGSRIHVFGSPSFWWLLSVPCEFLQEGIHDRCLSTNRKHTYVSLILWKQISPSSTSDAGLSQLIFIPSLHIPDSESS